MEHEIKIPEDIDIPNSSLWSKLMPIGLVLGAVGLAATFLTYSANKEHIFHSYLFAFMSALSVALGCLAFVIIQHVVRAGWSASIRRIAENAAMTLPLFGLLFIPLVFGLHELYHWSHVESLDKILQSKQPYLNVNFFYIRAVAYFVVWTGLAFFFYKRSTSQDTDQRAEITRSMWKLSGFAVFLYGISQSFAAFDWLMSQQPHWYSTIFGVYYFAGSMLAAFSFMTLVLLGLQRSGLMKTAVTVEHYHDLGKFLFGFTVFWAYIAFSQFFLIWYANIPEETEFYLHRVHHGWEYLSYAMPIVHFFVPFFFLLSRHMKRNLKTLAIGAAYVFVVHLIDIWWLVMPNADGHMGEKLWIDIAALVGVFGVFLAGFGFFLGRNKLVAIGDPRIKEALAHENF